MEARKGFIPRGDVEGITLLELLIVVLIVGILATLGFVGYSKTKEYMLDKEAISNLKMMRAAELSYKMDIGTYYPAAGSDANITNINNNLKLLLPSGATRNWNYEVWNTGCSRATRNGGDVRSWYLTINDGFAVGTDGEPNAGAGCP